MKPKTSGPSVEAAPDGVRLGSVCGEAHRPEQGMQTWTIPLTYTRPPLTLNQRMHWSHRARVSKQIHAEIASHVTLAAIPRLDRPTVTLHYIPRDKRRRDADNIVPTSKACVDGLRVCGVLDEDTPDHVDHRMPVIEPPLNGSAGSLILHIDGRPVTA